MDNVQQLYYELKFELFFYKERGNGFEDFFSKLMKLKHEEDFTEVKTWGNKGDLKCDGFLSTENTIFQVYAPNKINGDKLISKLKDDYEGALKHWDVTIKKWVFVQNANDGVKGIEAPTLQAVNKYNTDTNKEVPIILWGIDELKKIVFSLPANKISQLLGEVPTVEDLYNLQIKHIEPFLIPFRMLSKQNYEEDIKKVPENKIKINNLSEFIQNLLKTGMKKAHLIDTIILYGQDVGGIQEMSEVFRDKYEELKSIHSDNPDQIFFDLREFAGMKVVKNHEDELAILTILAYLFENCTIFEDKQVTVNV